MAFSRKATDRQRSEKKQLDSKGKKRLTPVAKEKYKNRFQVD